MNRAAAVYLMMVLILVAGLWTVLAFGSALEPPNDLAGKWQLSPAGPDGWGPDMQVEQSGKFFQIFIESAPKLDLKLAEETPKQMLLANSTYKVTFSGVATDAKQLRIEGAQGGQWTAKRITRKYPPDAPLRPVAKRPYVIISKEGH